MCWSICRPDRLLRFRRPSRRTGRKLSIALLDRRYCFDCFRPWTTTGGLLEAHHRRATRHGLKTAFDHMAYSAVVGGQLGWGAGPIAVPELLDPFAAAAATAASFSNGIPPAYQDYHAWQFTAAGFELIALELGELGLLDWHVEKLEGPENFEFFVWLRHGAKQRMPAAALQAARRDLLLRQFAETREQIDFMLGHPDGRSRPPHRRISSAMIWQPGWLAGCPAAQCGGSPGIARGEPQGDDIECGIVRPDPAAPTGTKKASDEPGPFLRSAVWRGFSPSRTGCCPSKRPCWSGWRR